jgi:acetyl-CoA C-acetyltransferase
MYEYDVHPEHLAMVAVKNHHNAVTNPYAHLRFEVTIEQVLAAPRVAGPFGLLDCTPQSDGAAALLLTSEEVAGRFTDRPAWVRGVGLGLDRVMHAHKGDMTTFPATVRAARQAYAMAGIGPQDVSVAEIHDCFSGVELMNYEDLGFCERGGGGKLIESGDTQVGGRLPVNPSGGLKAKGHPPGATGVAQCVELFEQLRGGAANQVAGARWGLAHNIGGPTAVSAVTILEGPSG